MVEQKKKQGVGNAIKLNWFQPKLLSLSIGVRNIKRELPSDKFENQLTIWISYFIIIMDFLLPFPFHIYVNLN